MPAIPLGRRRLQTLTSLLSERDWDVLRLVAQHRYLSHRQLEGFCFADHASSESGARTARRVLSRLERDGLLRALTRRIGGLRAGSAGRVWQLTPGGARLLRGEDARSHRTHEPSPYFLAHSLAVADVHLSLRHHSQAHDAQLSVQVEAKATRHHTGVGGEPRRLRPDLYAALSSDDFLDQYFIEVDLGTESLPTLLSKCHAYETYRATGREQTTSGSFPLVLWLMDRAHRVERLLSAITRGRHLTPELYRVLLPEQLPAVLEAGG